MTCRTLAECFIARVTIGMPVSALRVPLINRVAEGIIRPVPAVRGRLASSKPEISIQVAAAAAAVQSVGVSGLNYC